MGTENPFGPVPTPEEIAADLAAGNKPSTPQTYNVEEVDLWRHRHLPVGSVIVYRAESEDGSADQGEVAALITRYQSLEHGIWLGVHILGAEFDEVKKDQTKYFKGGRRRIHVCCPAGGTGCPVQEQHGLHLYQFKWYPAGDYSAPWLSRAALKKISEGPGMEVAYRTAREKEAAMAPDSRSTTERRLEKLKKQTARVSFADDTAPLSTGPARAGKAVGHRDGILRKSRDLSSAPTSSRQLVKVEATTIDLTKDKDRTPTPDPGRGRRVGAALAKAAVEQQRTALKKEERKKERSRSKKKRKRSRGKKKSSSSGSSSPGRDSSTESSSLLPPLKRKSLKKPGSVLKMLEQQAYDFLAQDGIVDEVETGGELAQKPKLFTYYQLALRPGLDPKSRDAKELALLAKALDTLREGKLDVLGDLLAARLAAVETATRQGWSTAKHLEIVNTEEDGPVPAHILLAAQKHGRQIEKAGGKGSWSKSPGWYGESQPDYRGKA